MSFYWPHAFWLLIVPLALLARDLLRRRATSADAHPKITRAEARHSSLVISHSSLPRGGTAAPRVRLFLILGLAAATAALARPQWGRLEEPVFDQAREILIALDLSRSMQSPDVKPTRLDRAKLLITSLLEQLKGERVGLVVFSGTAFLQSPLSADYEILDEFLPQLGPDFLPEGGTNYDALLQTCLDAFGASGSADRFLIILSDGEAQSDDWHRHIAELKAKGIRVIALGVGTPEGAMIPDGSGAFMKDERGAVVLSKLNNSTLRELADKTDGTYADASSWVDLARLLKATVDQGKRGEFKDISRIRLAERYQWALAPAVLLLVLSFWREFPVRPKPRALRLALANASSTTTLALLLLFSSFVLHPSSFAAEAAPPSDPLSAPITQLVGQLAARDTVDARDYATLAKTTLDYAQRLAATQQPVPPGPVNDALAAVNAGQSLNPKAPDWPSLRNQLQALLQKKDPPEQKKKDDKKQPDKNQSDPKKDDADKKPDKKSQDGHKNDPSKSSPPDQKKDGSSPQDQTSKNGGKQDDQKSDGQPDSAPPKSPGQSAFGDMKDKAPKADQPTPGDPTASTPPPGEMQQVGGTPADKKNAAAALDPALAGPLQKLDQVRQQDSPARLYQLIQAQDPQSKKTPAPAGHNW